MRTLFLALILVASVATAQEKANLEPRDTLDVATLMSQIEQNLGRLQTQRADLLAQSESIQARLRGVESDIADLLGQAKVLAMYSERKFPIKKQK